MMARMAPGWHTWLALLQRVQAGKASQGQPRQFTRASSQPPRYHHVLAPGLKHLPLCRPSIARISSLVPSSLTNRPRLLSIHQQAAPESLTHSHSVHARRPHALTPSISHLVHCPSPGPCIVSTHLCSPTCIPTLRCPPRAATGPATRRCRAHPQWRTVRRCYDRPLPIPTKPRLRMCSR